MRRDNQGYRTNEELACLVGWEKVFTNYERARPSKRLWGQKGGIKRNVQRGPKHDNHF